MVPKIPGKVNPIIIPFTKWMHKMYVKKSVEHRLRNPKGILINKIYLLDYKDPAKPKIAMAYFDNRIAARVMLKRHYYGQEKRFEIRSGLELKELFDNGILKFDRVSIVKDYRSHQLRMESLVRAHNTKFIGTQFTVKHKGKYYAYFGQKFYLYQISNLFPELRDKPERILKNLMIGPFENKKGLTILNLNHHLIIKNHLRWTRKKLKFKPVPLGLLLKPIQMKKNIVWLKRAKRGLCIYVRPQNHGKNPRRCLQPENSLWLTLPRE